MKLRPLFLATALMIGTVTGTAYMTQGQSPARAADAELEQLDQRVRGFLDRLSYNDVPTAFRELLQGSTLTRQSEALSMLEQKAAAVHERYGAFRSIEHLSTRRLGKDILSVKYLYHCESYPVAWHILFYRSAKRGETPREGENWSVIFLRLETSIETLLAANSAL